MSANPNLASGQLLELLLTLKKTTPSAAKGILNAQPAIAYALITLMVSMNAINIEVFQKTLSEYQANAALKPGPSQPLAAPAPSAMYTPPPMPPYAVPSNSHLASSSTPIPAIPPHMQANPYSNPYRTATPPHPTPTPPMAVPPPHQAGYPGYPMNNGYNASQYPTGPPPAQYNYPGYPPGPPHAMSAPPPSHHATPVPPPNLAATLAAIPDDQKALVLRVVSMTPEQVHALPPQERATYIQIRSTLGVPTPGA
ncbi:hypothetical protein DFP72DRAFT_426262 [Ephemerocybe angulata]|uniref:Cleavage stimulation factor subunit 2 hinge domain-containing protein n=1 Tax=Ephemerocybe angulata TaxID=980116 RepID=A0A8H6M4W8_9AGAR|nr:hypothetical protein DFP72DRAFT_426262 [Tulosesus angulatus]